MRKEISDIGFTLIGGMHNMQDYLAAHKAILPILRTAFALLRWLFAYPHRNAEKSSATTKVGDINRNLKASELRESSKKKSKKCDKKRSRKH